MIDLRGKHEKHMSGETSRPRFRVLGLGRAGISVLDRLVLGGLDHLDMVALDTDEQTLLSTVLQRRLLLGEKIAGGLGCWGDAERGYEIAEVEKESLKLILDGCDYLLITVGFGGGTGGGVLPKILEMAQAERVQTVVFGTLPYQCEGETRVTLSLEQVNQARNFADCVLTTSHERLTPYFTREANHRKGYEWMHQIESKVLYSILMLLEQPGLFPLSFADLRSLYGRLQGSQSSENCLMGYAEGVLGLDNEALLDDLLEGPLLAAEEVWREMDHALLSVSGGKELSVLEIQEIMRQIQNRFGRPIPVAVSAQFEGPQDGKIRLTLMLAKTIESEQPREIKESKPILPLFNEREIQPIQSNASADFEPVIILEMPEQFDVAPEPVETVEVPLRAELNESALFSETITTPELSFEMSEFPERETKGKRAKAKKVKQEELSLEAPNRGRFEKASETFWKGENLDQPTFKRRALYVRL